MYSAVYCIPQLPLFFVSLALVLHFSNGHTSMTSPQPVSWALKCVRSTGCGPCPHNDFRPGVSADTPETVVARNSVLTVWTRKNNHSGGFARWSLVLVKNMYNYWKHEQGAFMYTCHDVHVKRCNPTNKEFSTKYCGTDKENKFFEHQVPIPKHVPNGIYVLAFTWYGGLNHNGHHGNFADYYDCTYIRVEGGPQYYVHQPFFRPGHSEYGNQTHCKAFSNELGKCPKEPCFLLGNRKGNIGMLMIPKEFAKGKLPPKILRENYL